jgi:hypothetical protein
MSNRKLIKALFFSVFLFVAVNGYSQKDKGFNFPPDFGKTETLLIIGTVSSDKVTESIIEAFEKEYKGRVETIQDQYGKNVKEKPGVRTFVLTVMEMPSSAIPNSSDYKFGLTELKTWKSYECDFWSGSYKKGARYYAKHLEEFRKANGGK